ncbi:hypothetical protein UM55_001921 [Salmonella enterica subsp. enterica serovar Oranienburg]|nr:hypothetical protein [Salmonella enterica]EDW2494716.1 hypothetical protein [Salmonella enterica subsp. enterica serovar Oranienburg]EED4850090.1 hypothetical protein [Salmonella enterica subsp. arizonae]EBA5087515.1 hypothetical protein [Salmonella enterica]ECO5908473.1 hypothetical protein [Salmonella enterica]
MTNSASQATCAPFEHSLGIIRQASMEILLLLGIHTAEGKEPRWFMEQLEQARLNLGGWGAVAKKLRINDAQLSQFMLQLRHLQQQVPQYDSGQEVSENQLIAALRFVTSLEQLRQQQPLLLYQTELEEPDQEAHLEAQRQLRAIELTLKALIARAWPDRASLNHYLKQHFGPDRLRQWVKQGEDQHALEGMLFSELALMVVDKKLFARHYVSIFNDASALTLFVEPRTTLRMFLDDCRLARNEVIARQPLTSARLMLLNVQYQQIVRPIQRAYAEKRTRVNPASFLLADERELRHFWQIARLKDRQAGGDKHEISESIEPPRKRPPRTPEERDQLISGVLWGGVCVMTLAILAGAFWLFSTLPSGSGAAQSPAIAQDEPPREAPSARETITHMGITWDTYNMRAAIDRNDTRVTALFLQGGMNWQLAWTEQAFAARHTEVLQLLLRYSALMDEVKPCRRFITTLSHAMSSGAPLTAMHKTYLQTFCTVPAVVTRQEYDTEQARLRAQARPSADNNKWLKIQSAIYDAIH